MNRTALFAALGVAILGFTLLALYVRRFQFEATGGKPVELVMVLEDLGAGQALRAEMLGIRKLPEAYVEDRDVRQTDLHKVIGVQAGVPLRANQTLLWTDLATAGRELAKLSDRVRKGMRAMTIDAKITSTHSGLLQPGDRVDVILTSRRPGTGEKVTIPLLQNVLAIAVGGSVQTAFEEVGQHAASNEVSVTLAVTLEQATLLAHADDSGDLRLIVRNEDDVEVLQDVPETTDTDLMEEGRRSLRQGPIQVERLR